MIRMPHTHDRPARMADIAAALGLSVAAVSKALQGPCLLRTRSPAAIWHKRDYVMRAKTTLRELTFITRRAGVSLGAEQLRGYMGSYWVRD